MATPKLQNAYRNSSTQTDDIADLLLVTTSGLATDADAGASYLVYHNGTNDVLASSAAPFPVTISGISTAALQTTGNGILTTIDADTGAIAASAASIDGKTPALGQALAAASVPVVLTAAQISTLTPPAAITGFATETTLGTLSAKFASGTVIGDVNLGATDNAVLDAIAASVAAIDAGQLADGHNVTVSGSVTANIGTVGTLATAAKQDTGNTSLATLAGAVAGTEVQVDVLTMPTVAVTGTFWQATQPVSGTVAVTGTQTDALTDTQLRATAVPVSGTVTAELGATDNAVLDAIAASVAAGATLSEQQTQTTSLGRIAGKYLDYDTGGGTDSVVAVGLLLPGAGGAVIGGTAANPFNVAGTVELGATDNAVLDAIAASIASIDGKVTAANTGAVTISSALPAGTNNIGDVDVLSLPALPAGSNTIGAVNLAQYTPATGRLPVDGSGVTQPVSGTFWQATQPVSAASLPLPSNAAAETGGNLAAAAASLNVMDDWDESDRAKVNTIAGQAGVQGGSGAVSASTQRVVLATDVALPTGTNSIGQVTANAGTNLNTSALALESGGNLAAVAGAVVSNGSATQAANVVQIGWHVAGDGTYAVTDTNGLPVTLLNVTGSSGSGSVGVVVSTGGSDGGTLRAFSVDSNGYADTNANIKFVAGASVDVGTGAASTGTQRIVTATNSTIGTVTTVTTLTGGGVAHDSADSGNPIKVGARAAATLSDDTMVANADRSDNVADLDGALIVRTGFPLGDLISERVTDTSGTSTAFTNFAATASTRNYITAIVVYNSSATAGTIDFRDGTGGSVLYTVPIPATGGAVITNGGSPLFYTTANTALAYDVSGALTTVTISVTGFKSKARA